MADNQGERQWIVEPPAAGEVSFHMAVGEGVDLTAEQEAALSELMRTLESNDAEVTGHRQPCKLSSCNQKSCKPVRCATFICHFLTAELTAEASAPWNLMGTFNVNP